MNERRVQLRGRAHKGDVVRVCEDDEVRKGARCHSKSPLERHRKQGTGDGIALSRARGGGQGGDDALGSFIE